MISLEILDELGFFGDRLEVYGRKGDGSEEMDFAVIERGPYGKHFVSYFCRATLKSGFCYRCGPFFNIETARRIVHKHRPNGMKKVATIIDGTVFLHESRI